MKIFLFLIFTFFISKNIYADLPEMIISEEEISPGIALVFEAARQGSERGVAVEGFNLRELPTPPFCKGARGDPVLQRAPAPKKCTGPEISVSRGMEGMVG